VFTCSATDYFNPQFSDETPFCDKDLVEVKENGRYLSPLYLHCVHTQYPTSLFFIGLCWNLIPFVCFDAQVNYALALLDGTAQLPSKQEMARFQEDRLRFVSEQYKTYLLFRNLKEKDEPAGFFHRLADDQWTYFNLLAKLANRPCLPPVIQKIYAHVHDQRTLNLVTFKSFRYRIVDMDNFDFEPMVDLDCN
jgi:hypothetical protein